MGTIDGLAGLARARSKATNRVGMCFAEVSDDYGHPKVVGPAPGGFAFAINGWQAATQRHEGDYNAPAGAPVWFGESPTRTDKNKNAGDVGISMGGGVGWFTDAAGNGKPGAMTIAARAKQIARPYLGWTGDYIGNTLVNLGPVGVPAAGGNRFFTREQYKAIQGGYAALGYDLGPFGKDGDEGPVMHAIVKDFQAKHPPLTPDGVHGPATEAVLIASQPAPPPLIPPHDGPKTTADYGRVDVVQRALKTKYPLYAGKLKVDNEDGPATRLAVWTFQKRMGLVADSVAGPITRAALGV